MSLRDWDIFFRHSYRVRTLFQSVGPEILTQCSSLSDDVIFALSNPPTYGPLIPYLRRLYWDKTNKTYASLLRLLLTPSLVTLTLSRCAMRSPEVSILTSIGTVCPALKTLCISSKFDSLKGSGKMLDVRGEKILSEALLYLPALQSLSCPAIDESAIIHLSHLPFLADLSLKLRVDLQLERLRPFLAPPAFASVNSLTLHTTSLSTLTSLFEPMHFKPTTVSFVVTATPTPDAVRLFFLAFASACSPEQLSRISLIASGERQRDAAPQRITLHTLQSLLVFPNIHMFEFDVPCDIALDDAAITALAKYWPNLNILSLNADSGWGIKSQVTHKGLITFLARCPSLNEFALAVDLFDIDKPRVDMAGWRPGDGASNTKCVMAHFVTSTIVHPITIAAFLSGVCPELEAVKSTWCQDELETEVDAEEVEVYRERWEEVEILLPAFSAVRKQCMEWTQRTIKQESATPAPA